MVDPEVTTDPVPDGYTPLRYTFALPPDTKDPELRGMALMLAAWNIASRDLTPTQKDRTIEWLRGRLDGEKRSQEAQVTFQPLGPVQRGMPRTPQVR